MRANAARPNLLESATRIVSLALLIGTTVVGVVAGVATYVVALIVLRRRRAGL